MSDSEDSHVLKPAKFDINQLKNPTDKFGQQYSPDHDNSKWSDESPQDSRRYHTRSDTDVSPRSLHHTLGPRRNQASPGDHIHDGGTSKQLIQSDTLLISFTPAVGLFTQVVTFDRPYESGIIPVVTTNIASASGPTARWGSRADSISNTGFTLFLFKGVPTDADQIWSNIPVQWRATL